MPEAPSHEARSIATRACPKRKELDNTTTTTAVEKIDQQSPTTELQQPVSGRVAALFHRLSVRMTGESEEITMYPYQLAKVLADQHIHEMVAAAERRDWIAAARLSAEPDRTALAPQRRYTAIRRTMAQIYRPRTDRARSAMTSMSDGGPMGCSA